MCINNIKQLTNNPLIHISVWAINYSEAQNDIRHFWYIVIKKKKVKVLFLMELFSQKHTARPYCTYHCL